MGYSVKRKRNLDIIKLICAFFVVFIHMPFPGIAGTVVMAIGRVAVPAFFMITGFFYQTVKENGREKQQLLKVLSLTLVSNLLYFIWGILLSFLTSSPAEYIKQTVNDRAIFNFLIWNESPFGVHLWYLGSLLFALVILFFLGKNKKLFSLSYWLIPILLIGDLVQGKYSLLLWGREFDLLLVRNFLFVGLPYILLGAFLAEHMVHLETVFGKRKWLLVLLAVLFTVTSLLERWLLSNLGMNAAREHYLSTTFLACTVVILAVVAPDVKENNILAKLGKATSTGVYIFHMIMKDVLAILLTGLFGSIYPWVRPICVFVASVIFALVLKTAMGWLKHKKQEKVLC